MLILEDIRAMTCNHGDGWGYAHVQRVLRLIELISADVVHDSEALTWATYLHDWGAFPVYRQAETPHALRSRQIAEVEILPLTNFSPPQKGIILEAIERHDYQDTRPVDSIEALLLREADWLDMLGVIGMIREFASGPNDLRLCYDRIMKHIDVIQHRFTLPIARSIAEQRFVSMDQLMKQIMLESFAHL